MEIQNLTSLEKEKKVSENEHFLCFCLDNGSVKPMVLPQTVSLPVEHKPAEDTSSCLFSLPL